MFKSLLILISFIGISSAYGSELSISNYITCVGTIHLNNNQNKKVTLTEAPNRRKNGTMLYAKVDSTEFKVIGNIDELLFIRYGRHYLSIHYVDRQNLPNPSGKYFFNVSDNRVSLFCDYK